MCIYLTSHSHQYVGLHVSIGLSQLYNCTVSIVCFWKVSKVYDTARFFIIVWFCLSISFSFPFWPSFRVFLRFLSFDKCYKEKAVRTWHAWFPFHMGEKKKKVFPKLPVGIFFLQFNIEAPCQFLHPNPSGSSITHSKWVEPGPQAKDHLATSQKGKQVQYTQNWSTHLWVSNISN